MPIAVGFSAPPPPPPPPPPDPTTTDQITVTWIAPDGSEWPLTQDDLPWHAQKDAVLFGAAPIAIVSDPYPLYGARVRHVQPQPRMPVLPVLVRADAHMPFLTAWRSLGRAFTQTRRLGPGILRVERPDGSARQIAGWYQSGFEGQPGGGWFEDTAMITLFCEDPFWSATEALTVARTYHGSSTPFLNPFPTVSTSATLGQTTINNPGDTEAWPVWTITGPASGVDATNNTTGESFSLDPDAVGIAHGNLLAGETVTIVTQRPSVRGPDGSIWTAALNWPGAKLWGLAVGLNDVNFSVAGSGSGTSITLSFFPRFEMA